MNLSSLSDRIVVTPLSVYLQNVPNLIPTLQSIHLLAIAVILSSAAMVDLRLLGVISQDQKVSTVVRRFMPCAWAALAVLVLTGTVLIIAEPARSLTAFPFQLKVTLIIVAVVLTISQQRLIAANAVRWDDLLDLPKVARAGAAASIFLWLAIIVCGRWIAYA